MTNSGGVPDIFNPHFFNPAVDSVFASMNNMDPYNSCGGSNSLNTPQMPNYQPPPMVQPDPYNNYWSQNQYNVQPQLSYSNYPQPLSSQDQYGTYSQQPRDQIYNYPPGQQTWGPGPSPTTPIPPPPLVSNTPLNRTFDYEIQIRGVKLDDHDIVTKSDPYFTLSIPSSDQVKNRFVIGTQVQGSKFVKDWKQIYRSETIMDSLDPIWKEFILSGSLIVPNIPKDKIDEKVEEVTMLLEVYDWDEGTDDFIGNAFVTLRDLMNIREIHLHNKKRGGLIRFMRSSHSGTIHVLKITRKSNS